MVDVETVQWHCENTDEERDKECDKVRDSNVSTRHEHSNEEKSRIENNKTSVLGDPADLYM